MLSGIAFVLILTFLQKQQWSQDLKRKTIQYKYKYNYTSKKLQRTDKQIPAELLTYCVRQPSPYDQIIINNYQKGQGISRHIDHKDYFDNQISVISLINGCEMILAKGEQKIKIQIPRRSRYILKDEMRYEWSHEIPKVKAKRISITFRSAKIKI